MTHSKTYTASDFERYYNGSMPADEMYALERAALEDPFLADALEGYAHTTAPVKDLEYLRSRIHENKSKRKAIPLFSKTGWWRVAAILAVVAGGTYLFLLVNHTKQESPVAVVKKSAATHDTQPSFAVQDTAIVNDIASSNERQAAKTAPGKNAATEGSASHVPAVGKKKEPGVVKNLLQDVPADSVKFTVASNDKIADKAAGKIPLKKYFLKGRVVDEKGAPVVAARVQDKTSDFSATTDNSGYFTLPSEDSMATAEISAVGYDSRPIELRKNARTKVSLSPSAADLDEVVVTGYSSSNKPAAPSAMMKSKAAVTEATDTLGDYQRFNSYLRIHKQNLYDSNDVQLTGQVTLSFDTDEDGFPEDIKVLESTCKGCEENAIGLLKKGPSWTAKKKKQKVSIKY